MKILVLCERADAEGGTETYLRTLLPALHARGHALRIVARSAEQPLAYGVAAEAAGWSDEHDPPSADAAAMVARIAVEFAPDVAAVHNVLDAGVLNVVRGHAPRVVQHFHDHRPLCPNGDRVYPKGGGICGVAMGAPCAWHALVHGCAYGPRGRTLNLIALRQSVARAVADGDAAIAFSRYMGDLARRNGFAKPIHVLTPALEQAAYASAVAPRPAADAVLFAGRVVPSKGARSLVSALARITAATRPLLRIAGDGPDLRATIDEAHSRGVPTEMLGRLDAVAMRAAYDATSVVAVPSLWGEPFGLVGIEAFARGRPVVAYDAGAIGEWLGPSGGGHLVPMRDERALAEAIVKLLVPDMWHRASAGAFAASQAYRLDEHVASVEAIYRGDD